MFHAITVQIPARNVYVIVIAKGGGTDLSSLSRGTGVASAVLAAVERGTR